MIIKKYIQGISASRDFFKRHYSVLNIVTDGANWSLDQDALNLRMVAKKLGLNSRIVLDYNDNFRQCVHFTSQFVLVNKKVWPKKSRVSIDYYHGFPENDEAFLKLFAALKGKHQLVHRIRVSQSQIENLILDLGINKNRVFRIPIGVNLELFPMQTTDNKEKARQKLGVPRNAVVIGSFQKDGKGWKEGFTPKLIKGPDIFLSTLRILNTRVPDLYVLLTGPARGYLMEGLAKLGIPYSHRFLDNYREIGSCYQALDLYLVASREEGGPKALLESMASGVPLVTTRVGQARDLVNHDENAWMVEKEDVAGLAYWAEYVLTHTEQVKRVLVSARRTAQENSLEAQFPLWRDFFDGYVEK